MNIYSYLKIENGNSSENSILERIYKLIKLSRNTIIRVIKAGDVIDHSIKRKRVGQKLKKIDGRKR